VDGREIDRSRVLGLKFRFILRVRFVAGEKVLRFILSWSNYCKLMARFSPSMLPTNN
jgi:hypothetical protein